MFLIVGYAGDRTTEHVRTAACSALAEHDYLDLGAVVAEERVEIEWSGAGLHLRIGEKCFDFSDYGGFYSRLYFQATGSPVHDAALSEVVGWVGAYLDQCDALVINRPSSGWSNFTKLQHTSELRQTGFRVPESVITGSPEVAKRLLATGRWVSKPCSGTRSETVLVDEELHGRLELLAGAPTQFQEYIEGVDVRVHWLLGQCYPLLIRASGVDYRFGDSDKEFSDVEVPEHIAESCAAFCERAQLRFAGFDFKVDADGRWVALECNPMPGFDFYDRRQGGRIAAALVAALSEGQDLTEPFITRARRPELRKVVAVSDGEAQR